MKKILSFTLIASLCGGCSSLSFLRNVSSEKKTETKPSAALVPAKESLARHKKTPRTMPDMSPYAGYSLHVSISNGLANFHNIDALNTYKPVQFVLQDAENKHIALSHEGANFFRSQSDLSIAYHNGILVLDTQINPYAINNIRDPGVYFYFDPTWLQGKSYQNINSHGLTGLANATVTLQLMPS